MSCVEDIDDLIEYCPESPEKNNIRKIVRKLPEPRIIYVCSLCLRQYDLMEDLRGHMIIYHKYAPNVTQKSTPVKDPVFVEPRPVAAAFKPKIEIKYVRIIHPEMRPVPFKDFRMLLRAHMQMCCTFNINCAYKFANQSQLTLHIKCHKDNALTFACYICEQDFPNWRHCSVHLWKTHQIDVDLLRCPICTYKSPVSVFVWRHMRVHKKWRPRVLRSMRAVLKRRQKQAKETTEAAPTKPNKNKYYSEKTCEICCRKFVNGKTLSKHVKTVHNKIKPFICSVCGKKTARKASLIIHMRQHTGEKPLQCDSCKFSTRDPSVLHKHKLRHEKKGKLKCNLCDYCCIQANAFKRHMRLNHTEEFHKMSCDLCPFSTINALKLEAHREDHRKGLITNCEDSMDAGRTGRFKYPRKLNDKNNETSADCFMPLESIDSLPHEPAVDTGGVTIPAPSEDTQFPTYLNN